MKLLFFNECPSAKHGFSKTIKAKDIVTKLHFKKVFVSFNENEHQNRLLN